MEHDLSRPDRSNEPPASRHYFLPHKGKRILYVDFTEFTLERKDIGLAAIAEAQKIVGMQLPGSVLMITNVKDSAFDKDVVRAIRAFVDHNKTYVRRSAILGIKGLQLPLFNALNKLSGRKMVAFNSLMEARDWVVNDAD